MKRTLICLFMMLIVSMSVDAADKKKKVVPPTPLEEFLASARQAAPPPGPNGASLFSPTNPNLFLFHDVKAKNANDIVTIQIIESSTATNSANTTTQKGGTAALAAPGLLGLEAGKGSVDFSKILQANSQLGFGGTGSTSRTGQLQASLTARVVEVLPNGDLLLEGTKDVTINRERQSLKIRGVVRSVDVSPGNVVMSSAIAHMEVEFDGKGIVTNSNSPGWMHWLLTKVLPF